MSAGLLWAGTALLLSRVRRVQRRPLADRLRPYGPGGASPGRGVGTGSAASFQEVVGPLARQLGERISRVLGVGDALAARLERVHAPLDATAFRVRQLGWSVVGFAAGAAVSVGLRLPAPLSVLFVIGAPALAFLLVEQQLVARSRRWQRRIFLELGVISEQLGMLLAAGYSLGGALNRIAGRGHGACATDLARVCGRIRQGLGEVEALREWAALADVEGLHHLVGVLSLNREGGDLGRLIAEEARSIRGDVQRELLAAMERRTQQVWIPVTVATLVPGVLFLAVPFIEAMRLFSTS